MAWWVGDKCLTVTAGWPCGSNQDPFLSSVSQEIYRAYVGTKKSLTNLKGGGVWEVQGQRWQQLLRLFVSLSLTC